MHNPALYRTAPRAKSADGTQNPGLFLYLDFETKSECDLRACGHYRYAADPSTRILLMAFAVEDGPVQVFDLTDGPLPDGILSLLKDERNTIATWGSFDYVICNALLMPLPCERYYDLTGHAQMLACAADLKTVGSQLGIETPKDEGGKRLVQLFCAPPRAKGKAAVEHWASKDTHPQEWLEFISYAGRDVVAARACKRVMDSICPWPLSERQVYVDMLRMNDEGLTIDTVLAENAIALLATLHADVLARFQHETGLGSFNQIARIKQWCAAQGFPVETLKQSVVLEYLKNPASIPETVVRFFELRQEQPKAAINKYKAVLKYLSPDGKLRGMLRYHRAHTGRFAGVGPQIQNMSRHSKDLIAGMVGDPDELMVARVEEIVACVRQGRLFPGLDTHTQLKSITRAVIKAPPGYKLVTMDFSGVENRYLAWISGCESILQIYREDKVLYEEFALTELGAKTKAEAKAMKQHSKVTCLGCGYQLGWRKFMEYAKGFGLLITEGEAQRLVGAFRAAFPEIVQSWSNIERAVVIALQRHGIVKTMGHVVDATDERAMSILLPSGRKVWYRNTSLDTVRKDTPGGFTEVARTIRYDSSKPGESRVTTYGGKLIENIVQAGCRDLLTDTVRRCYEAGLTVLATAHDEVICLAADADVRQVKDTMHGIMCACPFWCASLPMDAAGFDSDFYRK